jgi:Fe(3+) dicitrate transport protein
MLNHRKSLLAAGTGLALVAFAASPVLAQDAVLEEFVIIGSREDARQLAGSGVVVSAEQISNEVATDINQLLKTVPGIYIREEEGMGLRPNIGIRGATSERSSKITLLEDGVMMAPAPYSAPEAYYFPTMQRQSAVEILKGAPLLRYGPQTTGGVVNLVSSPIARSNSGKLRIMSDHRGLTDVHGWIGGTVEQFSFLTETVQRHGPGFKNIDRTGGEGEVAIEDYLVKLGWRSESSRLPQQLQLKLQYSEENSEETYLGLSDRDFRADANRRYGLSEPDEMTNRHSSVQLSYSIGLTDNLSASIIAYDNQFKRDWFKLSGGNSFINAANAGDQFAQAVLDGQQDVLGLSFKHNNRSYFSRGVELDLAYAMGSHEIDLGIRVHEDEVDRFQPVEKFDQLSGQLVFDRLILPGSSDNRIGNSDATSLWLVDSWKASDELRVTAALRYEGVDSRELRFADLKRATTSRLTPSDAREWLPGLSFTYDLDDYWQVLGGVHRGFSPLGAGAADREDPETSTNYEAGVRYRGATWFVETVGFYSDFSNKTENCSVASPCSNGADLGSFKTGEAIIAGLEWQASALLQWGSAMVPLDFTYTWTDAEISSDNPVTEVQEGDLLKDIPEHIYSLRAGLELSSGFNSYLVVKYVDEQCARVACNRSENDLQVTDDLLIADWIGRYAFNDSAVLFLKVENLFDEQEIISRNPDGARPNKPRTAIVGIEFTF